MEVFGQSAILFSAIRDPLLPLWLMELLADVFFYAWLFAFGATVGSFLNVVIYRLPRGKNLAYPGSYCPQCGTPIRLADNIPIVSWLALRGRCRHCQAPIPPRYFVVELSIATLFLLVLAGEYFLPPLSLGAPARLPLTPFDGIPFWVMYAIHIGLVTTIAGGLLIAGDGFRVPGRLYVPALLAALLAPLIWPRIRTIAAAAYGELPAWQAGAVDGLAGLFAGAAIGFAFDRLAGNMGRGRSSLAAAPLAASLGAALGWQRVLWVAPLALLVAEWSARGLEALAKRRRTKAATLAAGDVPPPPVELPLAARPSPTPEAIQEEVHIAPAPTEPTESS